MKPNKLKIVPHENEIDLLNLKGKTKNVTKILVLHANALCNNVPHLSQTEQTCIFNKIRIFFSLELLVGFTSIRIIHLKK